MCPTMNVRRLSDTYGDNLKHYTWKYEAEGKFRKQINAQELWFHILDAQTETETGVYMLYKDHVNRKIQSEEFRVIRSSNLCTEIV